MIHHLATTMHFYHLIQKVEINSQGL